MPSPWIEYVQGLGLRNSDMLVEHVMALEWHDSRDGMSDFRRDIIADATMRVCTCRDTHSIDWSKWSTRRSAFFDGGGHLADDTGPVRRWSYLQLLRRIDRALHRM